MYPDTFQVHRSNLTASMACDSRHRRTQPVARTGTRHPATGRPSRTPGCQEVRREGRHTLWNTKTRSRAVLDDKGATPRIHPSSGSRRPHHCRIDLSPRPSRTSVAEPLPVTSGPSASHEKTGAPLTSKSALCRAPTSPRMRNHASRIDTSEPHTHGSDKATGGHELP